jgi:hypothetical protein
MVNASSEKECILMKLLDNGILHLGLLCASTHFHHINPLTPELNPSVQRCLMGFFTGDFAS